MEKSQEYLEMTGWARQGQLGRELVASAQHAVYDCVFRLALSCLLNKLKPRDLDGWEGK